MTRTPNQVSPNINDPPAITLEVVQKILHDQQTQTLNEVKRMIDERLGDSSRTLTQPQQNSPESGSRADSSVRRDPTPLPPPNLDPPITHPGVKKCSYKDFIACRPKEFKGDKDPKVVVRWITEMEQVLYVCRCDENMKVGFACQMLKDDALIWWNNLREAIRSEGISSLTWDEFVACLRGKFCSPRHQQKLVNDFFSLQKGNMTVDEYTKKFTDMLPFLGDTLPNEKGRVNRYLSGLPGDYFVEVGKTNTLHEAIEAAARVEDMLTKKASERVNTSERFNVGDKRKFVGASGFSKKGRSYVLSRLPRLKGVCNTLNFTLNFSQNNLTFESIF